MTEQPSELVPPVVRRNTIADTTAPDGSEIRLLVDQRHGAGRASLCEWHRTVEEVWYVLEERGSVWRCPPNAEPKGVEPVSVLPGDALAIPPGWAFQFSAEPGQTLRFLCYTTPPWPGPEEAQPAAYGGLGEATV